MTFNEPELKEQVNVAPKNAAVMWPSIVSIAREYKLELVAPCGTMDEGLIWYRNWLSECRAMYGQPCTFDYTYLRAYYQPEPCTGVEPWACLGSQASNAMATNNSWYREFGVPTWVTEIGCNPWAGNLCNANLHEDVTRQFIPYLDAFDTWFSANGFYIYFMESNTNKTILRVSWGKACPNRQLVGVVGRHEVQECVAKSIHNEHCYSPLIISMDGQTCYCFKDPCFNLEYLWPAMRTWRLVGPRSSAELTPLRGTYQMV